MNIFEITWDKTAIGPLKDATLYVDEMHHALLITTPIMAMIKEDMLPRIRVVEKHANDSNIPLTFKEAAKVVTGLVREMYDDPSGSAYFDYEVFNHLMNP